ncbi:MAG TPA: DUF4062 domain-containing protein [Baekduia sp.]|uniref:DUF4062 domain-containing protein n=1 Tax=Baekduia sp. TaxID=2600305 RepID=UPI002C383654|nr:DUF4062 domain-containing protein [Baekduia sp.]HMJ36662.1 DUF4062 domain-containing protein [Baekduia sp.]
MAAPIQRLTIFLASPGGLEAERAAVREVCRDFDAALARSGWQLTVLGWEDLGPASGRAQSNINPDVDACDVLIALLGDRLGTPTGGHESGFAEEWRRAHERSRRTGSPDLWLFRRPLASEEPEEDPEIKRVRQFVRTIEDDEVAFYKQFKTADELSTLVRGRLLRELFDRLMPERNERAGIAIDWARFYELDPVALTDRGAERFGLAEAVSDDRPLEAASTFEELAAELDALGIDDRADDLRVRAATAYARADAVPLAVDLVRRTLARHVWRMRWQHVEQVVDEVRAELPPELTAELNGWRACRWAATDPDWVIERMTAAMGLDRPTPLNATTEAHWRAVLWRCLLHRGRATEVPVVEIATEAGDAYDITLELTMLQADAARATGDVDRADRAWRDLRLQAERTSVEDVATAAWIQTRAAADLAAQDRGHDAERAFLDAASLWNRVSDGRGQAAWCFRSAQSAAALDDGWSPRGWAWRQVASTRGQGGGLFAARADALERQALHLRLENKPEEATAALTTAMWLHQRSGFFAGERRMMRMLADAYLAAGDHVEAVVWSCRAADERGAAAAAGAADDPRAVLDQVVRNYIPSSFEARYAVVARVGGSAPAVRARELVDEILEATDAAARRSRDERVAATQALAELAPVLREMPEVGQRLVALSKSEDFVIADAGRLGLRQLVDIGRDDLRSPLLELFGAGDDVREPDERWVATHIDRPDDRATVRRAALEGHRRALLALILDNRLDGDDELLAICAERADATLGRDLGMTPDGTSVEGLMALDETGLVAACVPDEQVRRAVADKLLLYASETRWPMRNRVNAVAGLSALLEVIGVEEDLEALRVLADPEADLDDEAEEHTSRWWAERGDLEAIAVEAAAVLGGRLGVPAWLSGRIATAMVDPRGPVRRAAWFACGHLAGCFDSGAARLALTDAEAGVRVAVLDAWRRSASCGLDGDFLARISADPSVSVRLALIRLLARYPDGQAISRLHADPDAYVRGVARSDLIRDDAHLP